MKKLYLLILGCLATYLLTCTGCSKSEDSGLAPLYTITAATYTENQVDYLRIAVTYLNEDVYDARMMVTGPDNNTTSYEYNTGNNKKLPALTAWSVDGIPKITGVWHFQVKGCTDFGHTVCFDSEKEVTVN